MTKRRHPSQTGETAKHSADGERSPVTHVPEANFGSEPPCVGIPQSWRRAIWVIENVGASSMLQTRIELEVYVFNFEKILILL